MARSLHDGWAYWFCLGVVFVAGVVAGSQLVKLKDADEGAAMLSSNLAKPEVAPALALKQVDSAKAAGRFTVAYRPPTGKHSHLERAYRRVRRSGVIKEVMRELNSRYALPDPVKIQLAESRPEIGPHYQPDQKTITMQPSFYAYATTVMRASFTDESLVHRTALAAFKQTLYHEVGHALIKTLELPVVGEEEDAADALGAYLSLTAGADSYPTFSQVTLWMGTAPEPGQISEESLLDPHSLNQQRARKMACLSYGRFGTQSLFFLFEMLNLGIEEDGECKRKWEREQRSWSLLLKPYDRTEATKSSPRK